MILSCVAGCLLASVVVLLYVCIVFLLVCVFANLCVCALFVLSLCPAVCLHACVPVAWCACLHHGIIALIIKAFCIHGDNYHHLDAFLCCCSDGWAVCLLAFI